MSNINQYSFDENNKKHGEWIRYYDNGQIRYIDNFLHGIEHGAWKGYDPDGTPSYFGYYNMGKQIGYWYYYGKKRYYLWLI